VLQIKGLIGEISAPANTGLKRSCARLCLALLDLGVLALDEAMIEA
jgi:hypothetical protein